MNRMLEIDPVFPLWLIATVMITAFAFFIWKEIRSNQRFAGARIIAQILVLISILGIILRPSVQREVASPGILMLTKGYDKVSVDSILKKYPTLKIIRTSDAEAFNDSEVIRENQNTDFNSEKIRFIAGEGLSSDLLALMPIRNFKFIPGKLPDGITKISVTTPVQVNHSAVISGIINHSGNATSLKLKGPGTEDSINLKGTGLIPFSFTIKSKQAGRFLYSLQTSDTSFVMERLPIEIHPERKLVILFLQKFPTAETRYLKNFLAERGHQIAIRYQTSKTNFNYEYANRPSISIGRLTTNLTESIDLMFIDSEVLSELSPNETATLNDAIRNGLGIIILDLPEKERSISQLVSLKFKPVKSDTVHLNLESTNQYTLPVQPIEISSPLAISPVLTHNNRLLSGYTFKGAGKISFQLLKETYRVRLEGNTDDYSFIWTPLIEKTSRIQPTEFKTRITNPFPYYQDQSLALEVISSGSKPTLYDGSIQLPLAEDVIIDDVWSGRTWASSPGWHDFSIKEDSTRLNYFVSGKNEWNALHIMNNMEATRLAESSKQPESINQVSIETRAISPILFFLLFLIASGFLWLAPKI